MSAVARLSLGGRLTVAAVVFGASFGAFAQKPSRLAPASSSNLSAHDLAERVDRHYNQLHSLKTGFTENYQGLGMDRTESGTLLLLKPGRMKWDYTSPAGKVFLIDGSHAWFYQKGDSQVQRLPVKHLDDLRSPLRFLLGHAKLEKELENLALTAGANGRFVLTGVPRGLEKRVDRVTLTIAADGAIAAMQIDEIGGALTRFTFANEVPDASLSAADFRFTPPEGVPVVDGLPPV
ncbi:MAG TPA: outer membrane lipoprotein carrier protein LolA [Terracidiphilus sp.]|nr:outer membrane lipoprotein carrier protein LolA [Terracidiphilus sp.]